MSKMSSCIQGRWSSSNFQKSENGGGAQQGSIQLNITTALEQKILLGGLK